MVVVCAEALIDRTATADSPGGGPFNTARAPARLGVATQFLGHLSTDALGQQLHNRLSADGVDLALTSIGPEPTTIAIAEVDSQGEAAYRFLSDGTSARRLTEQMVPASFGADVEALHVGTLGLVFEPSGTTVAALVDREHANRLVMVDPNIREPIVNDGDPYRRRLDQITAQSTIVKASDSDVDWMFPQLDRMAAARTLLARGPALVVDPPWRADLNRRVN
jgi:fructokinase